MQGRGRPDSSEPEGGWGYTRCCSRPAHFECLARHLDPNDKLIESSNGPVRMELGCPFCRRQVVRSSTRMLTAGVTIAL